MNSYLKLAVNADKNRVRFNFVDAIHVINSINISDYSVSAQIRAYASLEAYNYNQITPAENTPMPISGSVMMDDGRQISETNHTISRASLDTFDVPETITDPIERIKYAIYQYLIANVIDYINGVVTEVE
jgi:hypothetical protein